MKLKNILMVAVLMLVGTVTAFAQLEPVPADPDVRVGKLDNGLTYYIRYNNWPEHQAEFYIAQRVGSIQEDEDQRGLAHFLEHMCFNGTTHFPGNEVIRYCESIGVQFGRDLNAYTSIDRTVYNISNVPTTRQSALDSCLLILHDWADALILDPAEIDKERGVIHEEWRLRTSATSRMFERNLPALYPGSKYGQRYPIGLMSVVDNFKPQTLRDYYEKWYRPDNQGIIVVGDVDVDYMEAKIKELFSDIKMPENPAPVEAEPVPDNAEPIYIIDKDPEQRYALVELMFKHDPLPANLKGTQAELLTDYLVRTAVGMLNDRLAEYAKNPECPYLQGSADYGRYIFAKTKDAFELSALPKEGQTAAALQAILREARRAAEFGFTATEYQRSKANTLSALDKAYSNKEKRFNSHFVNSYVENFLEGDAMPSIELTYPMFKQIVPMIPLEAINQLMQQLVLPNDTNMVVFSFNTDQEGAVIPTVDELKAAVAKARAEEITAYVDNVKNEPLMATLPKPGKIKKIEENALFGFKTLTLSNGVKVIIKKTDYKQDQVLLKAVGQGGWSVFGNRDFANIKMFDDVIEASGLGNFSHTELEKALAGKIASASLSMSQRRQTISGSSTPTDVETMLQLVYLYFTNINRDQESFDNTLKTTELMLKNKALSPESALSDSLSVTLSSHNPLFRPLAIDDLPAVNYDRILAMAKAATANAAAYTFSIIGNYDEATLLPLIEQYIGSLPAQKNVKKGVRMDTPFKGIVVNDFRRSMETPKAFGVMVWNNEDMPYTLENTIRMDMASRVLDMIYLKKIREDASAAYTVSSFGSFERLDNDVEATLFAYCPMKPEMSDTAVAILRAEPYELISQCDESMLAKVKEVLLKDYAANVKNNGYWRGIYEDYLDYGIDMHTDYEKLVKAQTPQTICAFMREFLKPNNRAEIIMLPAE